ncbi:MAG TPA: methyltransferase domain-containing protein [Steroidobacteraceae bacterium]
MLARKLTSLLATGLLSIVAGLALAQRGQSPGINDPYLAPDLKVSEWVRRFEGESREVYVHRHKIVAALDLNPGQSVADVGAGTGLFVPLLAARVGKEGRVYAVDISRPFIEHITQEAKKAGLSQVRTVLSNEHSIELPADSVDMIFTSDAYHHFIYYQDMLASMHKALKPGGQLIVVDFDIESEGLDQGMIEHVGRTKGEFRRQIEEAGFTFREDMTLPGMKTSFIYRFVKS